MPSSGARPTGSPPSRQQQHLESSSESRRDSSSSSPSMGNGTPRRLTRRHDTETLQAAASPGKAKSSPQTNGFSPLPAKPRPLSAVETAVGGGPLFAGLGGAGGRGASTTAGGGAAGAGEGLAVPARSSPVRNGISPRLRASTIKQSPARDVSSPARRSSFSDSPSRQIWEEFSRMVIDSDREFQCKLEESSANQRQQHHDALQRAVEQHEYVRKSAETAKRRAEAEEELERRRREDEEMLALRRLERQKHEQELRRAQELRDAEAQRIARDQERLRIEREEKERIELDAKRALEAKERAEREVQRVREEEQRKAAQAEVDRKAKEAAEAAKKTSLQPPQSVPSTVAPSNTTPQAAPTSSQSSTSDNSEPEHERYLQIHKELKALRRAARNEKALKSQMGDLRRQITKSLGQLTLGKGVNKQPTEAVRGALREALKYATPTVDIRKFFASPPSGVSDAEAQVPLLLVYLLNVFSKAVITQFASEAGVSLRNADPIGVLAISIFAATEFQWRGLSLIDILLAKFHKVCPVLWGIYGSEKTERGRQRLGWARIDDNWVSSQTHNERMTGFGAGFAALSLRDFSKSKMQNPYPPRNFWRALAKIINTPPQAAQPTHFLVLKSMVECGAERFIGFYGQAALVALRKALVDFPSQAPKSVAAAAVSVLPEILERDLKVHI